MYRQHKTHYGKSNAELHDILAAVNDGRIAIVLLDPHAGSLDRDALIHLVARGRERRINYDDLINSPFHFPWFGD